MIARAVRLAQTASPTTSLVLLVAFNLVPLIGVLAWGWNVATLLVLYWVENGIVGILNVPKMLLAAAPETGTAGPRITLAGVAFTKGGQVVFFQSGPTSALSRSERSASGSAARRRSP